MLVEVYAHMNRRTGRPPGRPSLTLRVLVLPAIPNLSQAAQAQVVIEDSVTLLTESDGVPYVAGTWVAVL